MLIIVFSSFLILAAYPLIGGALAVWVLAGSQLALLVGEIKRRQVTGAGGFIFMSFLFFGVRPIYLVLENDKWLLLKYRIQVDLDQISESMWWATLALWCFALGVCLVPLVLRSSLIRRKARNNLSAVRPIVSSRTVNFLVIAQILTLPIMLALAGSGRRLYGSALGAYAYDFPVPLQAIHIFAVVVILEQWLRSRKASNFFLLIFSASLFLYFTWMMREVSMFRGFYVTGVMIVGIAVIQRLKGRASFAWLILPVVLLQPFFQYLGGDRYKRNAELAEVDMVEEVFGTEGVRDAYWRFYDSKGDMNIFDTFVSAKMSQPAWYPYAWSWFYVPFHLVPRAVWEGKPKKGVTMDLSCTKGYPTSPGIAGFFLLDGGLIWMLLCMGVLGFLVSYVDWRVLTMRGGYLQSCLIGIVTVNAMFLSRVFLWQYFYQAVYAAVPCILLAWWVNRNARHIKTGAQRANAALRRPVHSVNPA